MESLWSSQQDEVYFTGGGPIWGLWRHKQWSPNKIVRYRQDQEPIKSWQDFVVWRFVISRFHCLKKPRYREQLLPVRWPFVKSRFHCTYLLTLVPDYPGTLPETQSEHLEYPRGRNPPEHLKMKKKWIIVKELSRYLTNNVGYGKVCKKTWEANDGEE